jgi:formylglycine-generating enzyme required for sulfatase activity
MMGSPEGEELVQSNEKPQTRVDVDGFWIGKYEITQAQYLALIGTNPSTFDGSDNPVDSVTWHSAMNFCRLLSESTGLYFTLPTEAQWEYACRAGSITEFFWGDDAESLGDYAWFEDNSGKKTHPVGRKQANAWELYDMNGNVEEWCLTLFKRYPYTETDFRNSLADTFSARALRGGSWYVGDPRSFRSAHRHFDPPAFWNPYIGFRCVRIP